MCVILCVPFKNGVFISYSPLALLKASPDGLLMAYLPGNLQAGEPYLGLGLLAPWGGLLP